jgi:hypothetical protein
MSQKFLRDRGKRNVRRLQQIHDEFEFRRKRPQPYLIFSETGHRREWVYYADTSAFRYERLGCREMTGFNNDVPVDPGVRECAVYDVSEGSIAPH